MFAAPEKPPRQKEDKTPRGLIFVPNDFYDMVVLRYAPVVSLTYISSIIGVAIWDDGISGFLGNLLGDEFVYRSALWMAVFVSIPAMFWIFMRASVRYGMFANIWYKGIAGLLCLTLVISLVLFPEWNMVAGIPVRIFMAASIPMFFVQYWFFVRGGMPGNVAWPLTIAATVLLIYGLLIV